MSDAKMTVEESCRQVLKTIADACDQESLARAGGYLFRYVQEETVLRDCGQRPVCRTPPGCARHWEERNRELVRENDVLRSNSDHLSSENASLSRQVESMAMRIESLAEELAKPEDVRLREVLDALEGRAVIFDGLGARVGHLLDEMDEWIGRAGEAERLAEERLAHANQLQADIEAEMQGRLALRKRLGARRAGASRRRRAPGLARAMADTIRATVDAREAQLDAITADVKAAAPPGIEVERVPDGFRLTGQARPVGVALADSTPRPDGLHEVPIAPPRPVFSTWLGPVDVSAVQAEVAPLLRAALASVDEAAKLRAERDAIKATCDQHEARVDRARAQTDAANEALREFRSRCTCGAGS